ncbi:trypsin-like serine protease [Photobacterium damselae]|uniref:trypsin-like serine protease n=2 Tax=Photobacterium damselae TaxID=38293 RepID=UPI0040684BD0
MKKLLLTSLITLASTPALAIEGGTTLNWAQHDNLVRMNCTGTIIGGKFVLTADHCEWQGVRPVNLSNGNIVETIKINKPPFSENDNNNYFDMGVWELIKAPLVQSFNPLSMMSAAIGQQVNVIGFGEKQMTPRNAIREIDFTYDSTYIAKFIKQGLIESGDSGGPTLLGNEIVAVTVSSIADANGADSSNHTRLDYPNARKFILDTVNGWHYPTVAKTTNGKADIPIQSLFAENQGTGTIDLANISYDIDTIDGQGTIEFKVDPQCKAYELRDPNVPATPNDVKPFDLCTLHVTATNDNTYGVITLKNSAASGGQDAVITINPQAKPKPQPDNGGNSQNGGTSQPTNNGGSGGSTGILTLIGLLGIALKRKFF